MNKMIRFFYILIILLSPSALIFGEQNSQVELAYVIEIPGYQTVITAHPPYVWLDDNTVIVPIQQKIEGNLDFPLRNIQLLLLDIESGNCTYLYSVEGIYDLKIIPSKDYKSFFLVIDKNPRSFIGAKIDRYYLRYSIASKLITTISKDFVIENRSEEIPYKINSYPLFFKDLSFNDLYQKSFDFDASEAFDWDIWKDYYVVLGEQSPEQLVSDPDRFHDIRLIDDQGDTKLIFENIAIIPANTNSIPTMFQSSPSNSFLMICPQNFHGYGNSDLDIQQPNVLLIYTLTDNLESRQYETIRYAISQDIMDSFEVGDQIEVEKFLIDGSSMTSTFLLDSACK